MNSFARLIIADPSLYSWFGHHYHYAKAVVAAAKRRGLRVAVLCNNKADDHVVKELEAVRFFTLNTYNELRVDPEMRNEDIDQHELVGRQLLEMNRYAFLEYSKLSAFVDSNDLIFSHTTSDNWILGIVQWLMSLDQEKRPQSTIGIFPHALNKPHSQSLWSLCGAMTGDRRMRMRFATETTELATLYGQTMIGNPIEIMPMPHTFSPRRDAARKFLPDKVSADAVVVGYLGDTRANKGFGFLSAIVRDASNSKTRPVHFLIQVSNSSFPPDIAQEIEKLRAMPSVTLISETLSTEDYHSLLDACNIVLVTYSPKIYRFTGSSIFREAMGAGKVVIYPSNSAMFSEAKRFRAGGRSFREFGARSISAALNSAIENYDELASQAKAAAGDVLRYHSGDSLISYLLGEDLP